MAKQKSKPKDIDEYIASFSKDVQLKLIQIRQKVKSVYPQAEETIRYGLPTFKINGVHIYFSAYKKHIGMYPMYGMEDLEKDLKPYRGTGTKDSLHFPYDKPLPLTLIMKIIRHKTKGGSSKSEKKDK